MLAILDCDGFEAAPLQKALEKLGAKTTPLTSASEIHRAAKIVVPNVKCYRRALASLRDAGMVPPLLTAIDAGCPLLAVSGGMHLLFDVMRDATEHSGLGVVQGRVAKFDFGEHPAAKHFPAHHQGWNQVVWSGEVPMMSGLKSGDFFFFDHEAIAWPLDRRATVASANHGLEFCAAIQRDHVFGTQFLPERSDTAGQALLTNFVKHAV